MGACLSSRLPRSSSELSTSSGEPGSTHFAMDDDLKSVIRKRPELKKIADEFPNIIVPRIKIHLSDIDRAFELTRSGVISTIRAALVIYQHEKENKELQAVPKRLSRQSSFPVNKKPRRSRTHKNFYQDTVAELRKLGVTELAADELPASVGELKDAMGELRKRKQEIEKRLRSKRRWRKVWSVALNAAVVGVLLASVLVAALGAGPVAVAGATAAATVMKGAVEPFVNSILKEKEKALEEEEKIVEMMREGEHSLVHELGSVRLLVGRAMEGVASLLNSVQLALEATEEAVEVAMEELKKKIGEVEVSLVVLKNKTRSCLDKLERSESEFLKVIRD